MRRTINTKAMRIATPARQSRKIAAEAAQEVGPFSYTSATLPGITLNDVEIATNGQGKARREARLKIMAARRAVAGV